MNDGFYMSGMLIILGVLTYLFRNTPNPYIGVRLGYTYLSKEAWREANTFAAVYCIVAGLVLGAVTYFLHPPKDVILLLLLGIVVILAVTTYQKAKEAYERSDIKTPLEGASQPLTTVNAKPYLIAQLIAIGIYFLIAALLWNRLPETIAVHYSLNGHPDGFASKVMGVVVYPLIGFVIMPLFTVLVSKVPMLIRFPVFGRGQKLTLAFLTIMHFSLVAVITTSLLYNVGVIGGEWTKWAAICIAVITVMWAYWMWRHYRSNLLEE
ncbi:hypothetical protein DRN34_04065 [Thermococci archaeon]|nr:MAG: hypothetical protein DRN34_04065 [Thermococci archaeon]